MMNGAASNTVLHRPNVAAKRLGCTEWWLKEQARKRRIPYAWIGGSYRFSDEHIAEIVLIFERRPVDSHTPAPRQAARNPVNGSDGSTARLAARTPRRRRMAQSPAT